MRLLVVEDEKSLNTVLIKHLKQKGYSVDSCMDGVSALEYMSMVNYDCVILDIMLPGISGMEVLTKARKNGNTSPILMLTARDSVEDKVKGLDAGADDYMTKPFAFEELLARIRTLTRKTVGSKSNIYTLADLELNTEAHRVTRAGREIPLSSREFALLEYMIQNKGNALSREQILEHLWDYDYEGYSNIIDVYIRYLRKKIDEDYEPKLIHTIRGMGYVLKVPE